MRLRATRLTCIASAGGGRRALPTLDLQFAATKALDPRITFTRASTATYVDSSGVIQTASSGAARFDHNPITGESLGLLVEEARTNLRTYSDAILSANLYSTVNSTLTTVTTTTPTALTTASLLKLNAGADPGNNNNGINFSGGFTLINSTQHTQSLFVKPAGATVLRLRSNVSGLVVDFALTGNGTAPSAISDLQSASIVRFPDGWYRASWTFTTTTSAPGNRFDYWTIKTDVANGVNGIYVTGAQLEAGAFPTSYIPTVASTVTRAAEVASITGTNFSSWFNAAAGTVYTQARALAPAGTQPNIWVFDDGSLNNFMLARVTGGGATSTLFAGVGGTLVCSIASTSLAIGSTFAQATAYALNDFANTVNGGAVVTDTLGAVPVVNRATIGSRQSYYLNGTIARLTYFPTRLSNAELQALTVT